MAYYLAKGSSSAQYISFPTYSIAAGADFAIDVTLAINVDINNFTRILGRVANTSSDLNIGPNNFQMEQSGGPNAMMPFSTMSVGDQLNNGNPWKITITRLSNSVSAVALDTVTGISHTSSVGALSGSFEFNQIFRQGTFGVIAAMQLYSIQFDGARNYDPSASNGTGSILIDTVGGNDGTLVNFPTDNSQWVFYGEPTSDVDSTISAAWPSLAISATQQSTSPAIESSVNVTWPSLAISASQAAQAPEFNSTVAVQWPSLSVNATQSAAVPEYASTAAITWPGFTVQASQGAQAPDVDFIAAITWPSLSVTANQASTLPAYDSSVAVTWPSLGVSASQSQQLPEGATTVNVTWPNLSVSASQASAVPVFESTAAFTWPSLSVSAQQSQELPSGGASVSVQWPSLGVSAEQQSTIPEYTATINLTWPSFSVQVFAGEFDYFSDPTARIDLPAESRRIDLPFESRRIDLPFESRRIDL